MWTSFRQKILSGSSSASMVLGQSLQATKPNFTQKWKFYTTSMKEAFFAGKDSSIMRNVHSHVSLGSTFSSKPVSGIHSLKGGSYQPCKNTVSFSSISGEPGMAKTETLDQLNEKDRKVPMPRSMWKGPFVDAFLLRMKRKKEDISNKKIWSRRSVILPEYVNCSVRIYNGKTFFRRKITEAMVGHKFGEFALTRKRRLLRQNAALNKKRTNHAANKKKAKR